jgi:vacuolar-type H+-ATPase subunit E/Vma4
MAESLEAFVKKLQTEGVDAGKQAAEKIKKRAEHEAEKILVNAEKEAEKIIAEAKNSAEKELSRAQTELELAVRDTILKLRESLDRALSSLLAQRIEKKFSDADYLGEIIRELIVAYAKADSGQQTHIEVNVPKNMKNELEKGVLKDLFQNLKGKQDRLRLKAMLLKAGFEYSIRGATVEVSPDSVSELLSEMVIPSLQKIIDKVVGRQSEEPQKK